MFVIGISTVLYPYNEIGAHRGFVCCEPDNIDFKSAAPDIVGVTMFRTQGNSFANRFIRFHFLFFHAGFFSGLWFGFLFVVVVLVRYHFFHFLVSLDVRLLLLIFEPDSYTSLDYYTHNTTNFAFFSFIYFFVVVVLIFLCVSARVQLIAYCHRYLFRVKWISISFTFSIRFYRKLIAKWRRKHTENRERKSESERKMGNGNEEYAKNAINRKLNIRIVCSVFYDGFFFIFYFSLSLHVVALMKNHIVYVFFFFKRFGKQIFLNYKC